MKSALSIAGSDTSSGAGLQADLKTFAAFNVHGLSAITCLVSETPLVVEEVYPIPPAVLQNQIRLLLESYPVAAIKIGMLFSKPHIVAVAELLADYSGPIVLDPVMVASTGDSLLEGDAVEALLERLIPLATVLTPNLPEAGVILNRPISSLEDLETAAHQISELFGNACYLKGGHLENSGNHRDLLVSGKKVHSFESPHLDLPSTHGTGCTLSAALAAGLANGQNLPEAARAAHQFTHQAMKNSYHFTSSTGEEIWHLNQLAKATEF